VIQVTKNLSVEHSTKKLEKFTPTNLKNVLGKAVHESAANMGGTYLAKSPPSHFRQQVSPLNAKACE
jgi:hypothetical protein